MKKGAIDVKLVVEVIALVIGLALLIYFFFQIQWTSTIDKKACHRSVIERGTFNYGPIEPGRNLIPLKCKTEKICLSMSREDCEAFGRPTKENPVTKIEIENEADLMDAIADAKYDCHSMLGEGKVNYMSNRENSDMFYCLICSRIALDEQGREELNDILFYDLFRYMGEEKFDNNGRSYLNYIYPGWSNPRAATALLNDMKTEADNKKKIEDIKIEDWKIDLSFEEGYAVVSGMSKKGDLEQHLITSGVFITSVAGVILTATGVGAPVGIGLIGASLKLGAVAGGIAYIYTDPSEEYVYVSPVLVPYDYESLEDLKCNSFEVAP